MKWVLSSACINNNRKARELNPHRFLPRVTLYSTQNHSIQFPLPSSNPRNIQAKSLHHFHCPSRISGDTRRFLHSLQTRPFRLAGETLESFRSGGGRTTQFSRMPEKRRLSESEKSKIAEKISDFIMLMEYNSDFQVVIAKELNRKIWMSSETLCRKQCRELLYLLYVADTATLLSFTVTLGRVIWESYLRVKRRNHERKVIANSKQRESSRKKGGKSRLLVIAVRGVKSGIPKQDKGNARCLCVRLGFRLRSMHGFRVVRHRPAKNQNTEFGSRMYRLALAMRFLSFRNVCVTSEWELWSVYLVKQVFGFWRSIAIGGELNGSFTCVANGLGFDVVSCEVLERLQSCLRCSSTTQYPGPGRV